MLAVLVVAVLAAAMVIGWRLPAEHRAAREAEFGRSAESIWQALSNFPELPAWMPGVRRVQRLEPVDGMERWLYDTAEGDMTIEVVTRLAPTELGIRSVTSDLAFGGSWMHRISPTATGAVLRITEYGWISNPFFRFMFHYVQGPTSTVDAALVALGRHLGDSVTPRTPSPRQ